MEKAMEDALAEQKALQAAEEDKKALGLSLRRVAELEVCTKLGIIYFGMRVHLKHFSSAPPPSPPLPFVLLVCACCVCVCHKAFACVLPSEMAPTCSNPCSLQPPPRPPIFRKKRKQTIGWVGFLHQPPSGSTAQHLTVHTILSASPAPPNPRLIASFLSLYRPLSPPFPRASIAPVAPCAPCCVALPPLLRWLPTQKPKKSPSTGPSCLPQAGPHRCQAGSIGRPGSGTEGRAAAAAASARLLNGRHAISRRCRRRCRPLCRRRRRNGSSSGWS